MKKRLSYRLLRYPIMATLLIIAACSKDEISSPLVGKWEGISFTTSAPVDENKDGIAHTNLKEEMECVSMEAGFSSGGNFTITSTEDTYDIEIVNSEVVLTFKGCSDAEENGRWSLNENNTMLYLEFKIPGNPEPVFVDVQIELAENQLVMKDLLYSDDEKLITYSVIFSRK